MKAKNLKKSRGKSATPVTPVARSGGSQTVKTVESKPLTLSFQALNRFYKIEEDPITVADTGLSSDVEKAIKESRLIIPDAYSSFAEKFPCTGRIVSKGNQTKYEELKMGVRVMFARMGVQRYQEHGKSYCTVLEEDIHGFFLD